MSLGRSLILSVMSVDMDGKEITFISCNYVLPPTDIVPVSQKDSVSQRKKEEARSYVLLLSVIERKIIYSFYFRGKFICFYIYIFLNQKQIILLDTDVINFRAICIFLFGKITEWPFFVFFNLAFNLSSLIFNENLFVIAY